MPLDQFAEDLAVVAIGERLRTLEADQAFPAVVGRLLEQEGLPIHVLNAGVSGDTSAGGLARVDFSVQQDTEVCVVALGGTMDLLSPVGGPTTLLVELPCAS